MTKNELRKITTRSQKDAGFGPAAPWPVEAECPDCGCLGLTTGWGYWLFQCGAEILSCGEVDKPCPSTEAQD